MRILFIVAIIHFSEILITNGGKLIIYINFSLLYHLIENNSTTLNTQVGLYISNVGRPILR
jgi:hypothetical protein